MSVPPSTPRFALTGAAGFVAPRHMQAIRDVNGELVAALDPHDAVGVLDRFNRSTEFFVEPERFERHLDLLRRIGNGIDWLSVCSPNHLHDVHSRLGLRAGANVICEKPLTLSPWNLDALAEEERRTGRHVYTVLQLRLLPALANLRSRIMSKAGHHEVEVRYVTPRGPWYQHSWKGDPERSGGLVTNIGIHLFDALLWVFGRVDKMAITLRTSTAVSGTLHLERAFCRWFLSIDGDEPCRKMTVDGEDVLFSDGFNELHTRLYEQTLRGLGYTIESARPAVELAHRLRSYPVRGV
ncbi:MAG: Gfo/Idh/MocA family oxidoreductase [Candidatus Eremiobacteraeota bacterium]|nr:Gfo/Idh/MocA family oxidoreductase [Candidatus Eremiobacteraeota bacterium]